MMTNVRPEVAPEGRYAVCETCKLLTISRVTLAAYTKAGKIKCGYRRTNGRKFYLGQAIINLWKSTY